jgi:MFS family permease
MIKSHAKKRTASPLIIGWIVTVTVILFYAYEYFLRSAPSPMYDYFTSSYGATANQIGLIDASYYWTYIPMQILVGTLLDHYGVRKPLFLAIFTCIFGSVLFGIENNIALVIFGRTLIGFGSAFGFVAVLKTATLWLPKKFFPLAVGIATSLGMLGAITGLVVITSLMNNYGIETTIDLAVLIGLFLLIITYFIVYDKKSPARQSHANKRLHMIKMTFMAVITNPQVWLAGLIGLALYLPTQLFGLWGMPYFVHIHHLAKPVAAQVSSLLFWGWIIGSPIVGFIAEYVKNRRLLLLTGALVSCILLYTIIYLPLTQLNHLIPAMFLLGVFSSVQILTFDIATSSCRRSHAGTAVAVTNMFVMLGGPLQVYIGGLIESYADAGEQFTQAGFQQAFIIMPIMCLLAFFITFLLKDNTAYD